MGTAKSMIIGRGEVDFQVSDSSVSRQHFRLFWEDGRLQMADLGSSNGTRVLGGEKPHLEDGDIIGAGDSNFRIKLVQTEPTGTAPRVAPAIPPAPAQPLSPSETALIPPEGELFSTLSAEAKESVTSPEESEDEEDAPDQDLEFGIWKIQAPAGWEHTEHLGFSTEFAQKVKASVILNDDKLEEGQSLVDYVGVQIETLENLLDEIERSIQPIQCPGFDEGLKLEQKLKAADGTDLNVVQAYLRIGQQVAITTCTTTDAPVDQFRRQFNLLFACAWVG